MSHDLGRSAARGALATAGSQGLRIALQIGSLAILARLLTPQDYGLLAMALAVVGIGHMFRDMGLFTAAVRAPNLTVGQRDNLFWVNTGLGLALTVVCVACGPLLAAVYDRPEMVGIAAGLAPTFMLAGLATQYRANLVRDLRFQAVAASDLLSQFISVAVAVCLAVLGAGYWALVAQHAISGLTFLAMVVALGRWRPGRYRRDVSMRPLLSLGGTVMFSGLLTYLSLNVDAMVIGARFGAEPAGLYNRGTQLVRSTLKQLSSPVSAVAIPVMGRLQDDAPRLMSFARKVQIGVGYPTAVVAALVVALPADVLEVALGVGWLEASDLVVWMALTSLLAVLGDVVGMILIACGRAALLARFAILTTGINIVAVLAGVEWGPIGIARGLALAGFLNAVLALWMLARAADFPVSQIALGEFRILAVCGSSAAVAHLSVSSFDIGAVTSLSVGVAAVLAWLLVLMGMVPAVRRDAAEVARMLRAGIS